MRIAVITGTRPNFIDLAPVMHALKYRCDLLHYNTGQHYDREMSQIFFDQLRIPAPNISMNIGVNNTTAAQQIGTMLMMLSNQLEHDSPDLVVVKGDTNTTLAGALAANKLGIPVAHVEAGARCFDASLPEEVNRILVDHIANYHFATLMQDKVHLTDEHIDPHSIYVVGHPAVDAIDMVRDQLKEPPENLQKGKYWYMTLHRDFNVDHFATLKRILIEIDGLAAKGLRRIIFPVHPRTAKRIEEFGLHQYTMNLEKWQPADYISSLSLQKHAYRCITDSGGLQKECAIFGTPVIALRKNTEWYFTLEGAATQLAFEGDNTITKCVHNLENNYSEIRAAAERNSDRLGTPGFSVSHRIADILLKVPL